MNLIIDRLYLGNILAASDHKTLVKYGITHIVRWVKEELGRINLDYFKYEIVPIDDLPDANVIKYFDKVHKFIDDAL